MKTQELQKKLLEAIPKRFEKVLNPDHPYLLSGPDVLAGGEGHLFGFFLIHTPELKYPDELLVRMARSRIAYPDNFVAILALPTKSKSSTLHRSGDVFERDFDAVVNLSKSGIHKVFKEIITPVDKSNLPQQRRKAFANAELLYTASLLGVEVPTGKKPSLAETENKWHDMVQTNTRKWSESYGISSDRYRTSEFASINEFLLATANIKKAGSVGQLLGKFGRQFFELDHALDNGIPYRQRISRNIVVINERPFYRFDPDKFLRASAFSGFALFHSCGFEKLERQIEHLEQRFKKVEKDTIN